MGDWAKLRRWACQKSGGGDLFRPPFHWVVRRPVPEGFSDRRIHTRAPTPSSHSLLHPIPLSLFRWRLGRLPHQIWWPTEATGSSCAGRPSQKPVMRQGRTVEAGEKSRGGRPQLGGIRVLSCADGKMTHVEFGRTPVYRGSCDIGRSLSRCFRVSAKLVVIFSLLPLRFRPNGLLFGAYGAISRVEVLLTVSRDPVCVHVAPKRRALFSATDHMAPCSPSIA